MVDFNNIRDHGQFRVDRDSPKRKAANSKCGSLSLFLFIIVALMLCDGAQGLSQGDGGGSIIEGVDGGGEAGVTGAMRIVRKASEVNVHVMDGFFNTVSNYRSFKGDDENVGAAAGKGPNFVLLTIQDAPTTNTTCGTQAQAPNPIVVINFVGNVAKGE
jgi:hypothetical protein